MHSRKILQGQLLYSGQPELALKQLLNLNFIARNPISKLHQASVSEVVQNAFCFGGSAFQGSAHGWVHHALYCILT